MVNHSPLTMSPPIVYAQTAGNLLSKLECESKKLQMMQQQYRCGENMELPNATLEDWQNNLHFQAQIVHELKEMVDQRFAV